MSASTSASTSTDYDYLIKLLLIGDSGIGKSHALERFCDDTYTEAYISTIGVDFKIKTVDIDGKTVKLQMWDTAGQERFRTITSSYYRGGHGIVIMFDTTSLDTFEHAIFWLNEALRFASANAIYFLVGTKCDLTGERQVDRNIAEAFARERELLYFETSAKTGEGINEAFMAIAASIKTHRFAEKLPVNSNNDTIDLQPTQENNASCVGTTLCPVNLCTIM